MAETLEALTQTILSDVEAAKGIAPFLHITIPEPPKEWKNLARAVDFSNILDRISMAYLFITNRERYNRLKKIERWEEENYQQDQKEREKRAIAWDNSLRSHGLITPTEKDAYDFIIRADLWLEKLVQDAWGGNGNHPVEVLRKKIFAEDIRVERELFEEYIGVAVESGIRLLKGAYWVESVPTPEIVNPEFKKSAVDWLQREIYQRIDCGDACVFISRTSIRKDGGKIRLQSRDRKERNKTLADQYYKKFWPLSNY